jgi:hypothetical protein
MPAAIEEMSVYDMGSELLRTRARDNKRRANEKAAGMQLAEKGTAAITAFGIGMLEQQKPELASALGGIGYANPGAVAVGSALFFFTKGMAKEAGSGMLMAGMVPLLNRLGAMAAESLFS